MSKMNQKKSRSQLGGVADTVKCKWNFAKRVSRFGKDEEGAMVILALFVFMLLLVMGGIGIDMMRHEMERAHLAAVLDNAVLAGAAAPYGEDPKEIVVDYFAKSNMSEYLHEFVEGDIITSANASKVTANASMTIDTYLMKLSGVETLAVGASATAERRVPKVEIVLVLDVSGSMGNNSKIDNLRIAAKDFVTTIMNASLPGDTVISIVPFSTSVTPSNGIYKALAVDETHQYSNCLYLDADDYTQPSLTTDVAAAGGATPMKQAIYTSRYGNFEDLNDSWRSCYTDSYFQILPYSISETQLNAKIDSLLADGNTSTDQGVKWGAALLGPGFRDVSASLIDDEDIDVSLSRVPVDYSEPETLKIMIVMGDGQNTTTYFFNQAGGGSFRGPNSGLFKVEQATQVFDSVVEPIYYLKDPSPTNHDGDGASEPYYNIDEDEWIEEGEFADIIDVVENPGYVGHTQLSWEEAWGLMSPRYYGQKTGEWGPEDDYVDSEYISGSTKNTRMGNICTTLKGEGAYLYTIGFEVPVGGTAETNLRSCASSVQHYYRAAGLSITNAFSSIAANVQSLRLTQ